ncbi:MAG TPA: DUF4259 domain-containing protein [Myxococcaceae bacterium]|nr:DUF4259 domain-containing protein [Myxococcaceae bacterium]
MWGKRWLSQLQTHDPEPIERALEDVQRVPPGQPLDAEAVRRGLAACEVVAASAGRPAEALPVAAHGLAERHAHRLSPLRRKARAVLNRIRSRPEDEVDPRDLYDEPDAAIEQADDDALDWRTDMDLLDRRLAD